MSERSNSLALVVKLATTGSRTRSLGITKAEDRDWLNEPHVTSKDIARGIVPTVAAIHIGGNWRFDRNTDTWFNPSHEQAP